jgi:hypothetical protein
MLTGVLLVGAGTPAAGERYPNLADYENPRGPLRWKYG